MKRTLLLPILALVSVALLPLTAAGKIAPDKPAEPDEISYKYEAYVGYGYTSINQVNQSRHGLQGVNVSITRDWGKYFGLTADGAIYKFAVGAGNPGDPSVDLVLFGPVVHAKLIGRTSGFFHVLLGVAHTGGNNQTPDISFARGLGVGLDRQLTPHVFLRASGDSIASSFTVTNPSPGDSPHTRSNARATIGVVYKF